MTYTLKELKESDHDIIKIFYEWKKGESQADYHTCRPIKKITSLSDYRLELVKLIDSGIKTYYLVNDQEELLGKVSLFDINTRNRSAEFGYYIPFIHRGKGYGSQMVKLFIDQVFSLKELHLHKLCATTASGNQASNGLLRHFAFKLDGVLREHFWINNDMQDQHCYSLLRREAVVADE